VPKLNTHSDAIEVLRRAGIPASRREWVLGDTVVVPLGRPSSAGDITAYPAVAWLVPTATGWRFEQPVANIPRIVPCSDLSAACDLAIEIARSFTPKEPCTACGFPADLDFGDRSTFGRIQHWTALRCAHCGSRTESDGVDPLPNHLRDLELLRYGAWAVVVESPVTTTQWKLLRPELRLSLQALRELKSRLPGRVFSGTFPEARLFQNRLARAEVMAQLEYAG
jgi:hypothetical protein